MTDKPKRRRFTVEYKLSLLKKADAYRHQPGKVGALLRREGVYSSTLSQWRRQREEGTLSALKPKRRGRKIQEVNPLAGRVTELEREVQQLQGKLRQAETIIDVQKKTLRARVSSDESPGELKQRMMTAAQELSRKVGVRAACEALEVSPATFYRRRQSSSASKPSSGRASSPRALAPKERQTVHDTLNSERFVDQAPTEVYATLLDAGKYLCSVRTMYRILEEHAELRERRDQLRHPNYEKAGPSGDGTQPGLVLGHHEASRSHEVGVLPPVRDPGHF